MRCTKCGYVTFDRPGECPRCGRSLPEPLVAVAAAAPSASRMERPAFLSPLMLGPIPRFYGGPGDPDVFSLLEPEEGAPAAPAGEIGEAALGITPSGLDTKESAAADAPFLGELAEGMEEIALPGGGEAPAVRAPRPERPLPRREERPKAPAAEEADDLLASLDLEESPGLEAAPPSKKPAGPVGAEADVPLDAISERDLFSAEDADAPPRAPSRPAPAAAKGVAAEEDEELAQFLASEEDESPAAEEESPAAAAATQEDEDLLSLLNEADEAAPAAPAAPLEAPVADLLPGKEEMRAKSPASPARGRAVSKNAEEADEVSNLWADAFTEEQAAPSPAATENLLDDAGEIAASQPAGAGGEDDLSSAWAGALDEEEGAPAAGRKGVVPPVGASAGGGEDSLSDMWTEAFAEQEAAAKAQRTGKEAQPKPGAAAAEDLGEGDLEKMWSDALNEAGDASPPRVGMAETPAASPRDAGEADLSKEDLGGFLEEADAPTAPSGAAPEEAKAAPAAEEAAEENEKAAPVSRRGGGFMVDEDPDEIEAYVPEEAPAAAAAEPKGGDFLDDAGAPSEEPEKEEQAEVVGVPLSVRFVAGAMDFGVLAVLQGLFSGVSFGIVSKAAGPVSSNMEALILLGILNLAVLILLSLLYSVYFVGMFGCTPGHRSMGLSVVDMDDKPVEYMQAVLRFFGGLAAGLPLGLGHLLVLFDKRGRGLGDRLAGTHVVLKVKV